jgi:hypothetical protein
MRKVLVVVLGLLALAPVAVSSSAATKPHLTVKPPILGPGEHLTMVGRGFGASHRVTLLIGPPNSEAVKVASTKTNRKGRFSKGIFLANDIEPGEYVVLACRRSCAVKASAKITVGFASP